MATDWLPVIGSAIGGLAGLFGQSSANATQSELMDKQMDFQREVLQNRYQWTTQDLKAAGINPIMAVNGLSAGQSSGVSAPQVGNVGAAASASAAQMAAAGNSANESHNRTMLTRASANAQDAAAKASTAQALDLTLKGLSDYWERVGRKTDQDVISSAAGLEISRARLQLDWQDASVRWSESMQRVELYQSQIQHNLQQISMLKSQEQTEAVKRQLMMAERSLKYAQEGLVKAQESLTYAEADVADLEYKRRELQMPELEYEASKWSDPAYIKWKRRTEHPLYGEVKGALGALLGSPLTAVLGTAGLKGMAVRGARGRKLKGKHDSGVSSWSPRSIFYRGKHER